MKNERKLNGLKEEARDVVRREMAETIDVGFRDPNASAREVWGNIVEKGDPPTPEEFIYLIARAVLEQR